MKRKGNRVLLLGVALAVVLSSCAAPAEQTPAPQESESTTTTTTTAEVETTSSTADTTETTTEPTTTTTAKPTTSTTKKSTTKKTTKATATTEEFDPYAPYEDSSLTPAKDKRCLLLNFSNEEIEMTFEKALVYPKDYDRLTWLYTGTTRNGTPYSCEVVADQERIFRISCDVEADSAMFKKDEALVCLKRFFKANKISCNFDKCGVVLSHSKAKVGQNGEILQKMSTYCTFQVPLYDDDVNRFKGRVNCRNGKLYVSELTAQTRTDEWIPGYSGDDIPLLIPRWKSE